MPGSPQLTEKVFPLIGFRSLSDSNVNGWTQSKLTSGQMLTGLRQELAENIPWSFVPCASRCIPYSAEKQRSSVTSRFHNHSSSAGQASFGNSRAVLRTQTEGNMDSNYVFLCGVMWCRYRQEDAGSELMRAAECEDPDLSALALAMLREGCLSPRKRASLAGRNFERTALVVLT